MTTIYTPTNTAATGRQTPCRCHEAPPAPCTCCGLTCFDRPNYFCGHLLTDGDLSLEQKYVIEKNKMYHRAIDGYGVACGLKLTCDCQCKGNIRIEKGFAIDNCGNDLVVCEDTRFDVIGALKRKGLLLSQVDSDDKNCEPERPKSRCSIKQCFYVTICYDEHQSDYETPYQSGCSAGPKQCLPTRTQERVRFDVTDQLPKEPNYLAELEKRFKECFRIYCEGPIGQIIKKYLAELQEIVSGKGPGQGRNPETWKDPCELFCIIKAYFLNQLKNSPDEFNCGLYDEVACLRCPEEKDRPAILANNHEYATALQEVFTQLLTYLQRYQFDCALGELVFCCEEPCESHCLVLGTVEVVAGKLTRVCNTPRKYLWSPANFVKVALFTLLTGALGKKPKDDDDCANCCPEYPNFNVDLLLREFALSECGRYHAVTASLHAVDAVRSVLHQRFDFSDTHNVAAATLLGVTKPGEYAGIKVKIGEERATSLDTLNIAQVLVASGLLRQDEQVSLYHAMHAGDAPTIIPDFVASISPDRAVGKTIEKHMGVIKKEAVPDSTLEELRKRIDSLEEQIKIAQAQAKTSTAEEDTSTKPTKKSK